MFPETELLLPPALQKPSEETFFIDSVDFHRWVLFGDEWIELDESMFTAGLCAECRELGYCKKGNNDFTE